MHTQQLLYPMFIYVSYICSFPLINLVMRIKAVKNGQINPKYFKTYSDKSLISEKLLVFERHTDNQFQVPLLYFVTCSVAIASNRVSMIVVYLAWSFIVTRFIHSYIHLGKNKILHRALIYALGLVIVVFMWISIVFIK